LTYEYDKSGNRTKIGGTWARTGIHDPVVSASYNAANQQLAFGDKTLTYDNNGNVNTISDPSGTTNYNWNTRNQLNTMNGPGFSNTYGYDGMGRREKKIISGSLTEFLYDGVNPVQETSGATILANILPGLGTDEFFNRSDVAAGATSNLLTDALGSTIALADSAGALQTEYTYEPFGRTILTGASSSNPLQYTGRENDGAELYHYRARYYQPNLGRFASEDPIGLAGGVNFYAYVLNNPLNLTDPQGLLPGGKADCNYYDGRCERGKCDRGDPYSCQAAKCCRDFGEGLIDRCVRKCLISNDRDCADLSEPGRSSCRFGYHTLCYLQCFKLPMNIPPSCSDVKWGS
jgi:RHS repeat-associated protein